PWPGNIRELSNVIERAALLVESQTIPASALELAAPTPMAPARSLAKSSRRERIQGALERHDGNITTAAKDLGVSRKTMRDWMRQEGLYPGSVSAPAEGTGRVAEERDEAETIDELPTPQPQPSPPAPQSTKDIHWERRWITLLRVSLSPDS